MKRKKRRKKQQQKLSEGGVKLPVIVSGPSPQRRSKRLAINYDEKNKENPPVDSMNDDDASMSILTRSIKRKRRKTLDSGSREREKYNFDENSVTLYPNFACEENNNGDEDDESGAMTASYYQAPDSETESETQDFSQPNIISSQQRDLSKLPGWRSPSELLAIARIFKGTAIQYRVCYINKAVKDSYSKKMILPDTLVVQSRLMSKDGNKGGQTFCFMTWGMPGCRRRSRSIYKETKPRLWSEDDVPKADNAYPLIILDDDLHPVVRLLVTRFINEATPGSTPLNFYEYGDCGELFFLSHRPNVTTSLESKPKTAAPTILVDKSESGPKDTDSTKSYSSSSFTFRV